MAQHTEIRAGLRRAAERIMEGWYKDVKFNPPASLRENDINKLEAIMYSEIAPTLGKITKALE